MLTASQWGKEIKQPRGGYLPQNIWNQTGEVSEPMELGTKKDPFSASILGSVVEYMTAYHYDEKTEEILMDRMFSHLKRNAVLMHERGYILDHHMRQMKQTIDFGDVKSEVQFMLMMAIIDSVYKSGYPMTFNGIDDVSDELVSQLTFLRDRSIRMIDELTDGDIVVSDKGLDMSSAFSPKVSKAEIDMLAGDTIIDMKCTKKIPNKDSRLTMLIYLIIARRSSNPQLKNVKRMALVEPRLNIVETLTWDEIDSSIIKEVEGILGY